MHLYGLYATAVENAGREAKDDAEVLRHGAKAARMQQLFNEQLARRRLVAARTGEGLVLPKHAPKSTPEFLALGLVEQRRMATAMESLAGSAAAMVRIA